ncbi:hypothetical protein MPQ_0488 [Methylovorus sp. MP688]|nr:hypothetical protein MPQ_0488 [Methylovorus sp. MP688]
MRISIHNFKHLYILLVVCLTKSALNHVLLMTLLLAATKNCPETSSSSC